MTLFFNEYAFYGHLLSDLKVFEHAAFAELYLALINSGILLTEKRETSHDQE